MKRDLDHEEAAWVEQRQAWLAIALKRAQDARMRGERIPLVCSPEDRAKAVLAAKEGIDALARALEIRKELVSAGYGAEPWLEEVFQRIREGQ